MFKRRTIVPTAAAAAALRHAGGAGAQSLAAVQPARVGLLSLGSPERHDENVRDSARQGARDGGKMLEGSVAALLPVEQPTRFALVDNLKTARGLGVVVPSAVLVQADRVIA